MQNQLTYFQFSPRLANRWTPYFDLVIRFQRRYSQWCE